MAGPGERRCAGAAALAALLVLPALPLLAQPVRADSIVVMPTKFPPRYGTSAAWDGASAYVFGGYYGTSLDQIVRYDPIGDVVVVAGATLPTGRRDTAAVWDGRYAYVFGGQADQGPDYGYLDDILRYDPATDAVSRMAARLPTPRAGMVAVWDGQAAWLLGGVWKHDVLDPSTGRIRTVTEYLEDIVRYDPASNSVITAPARLPVGRGAASGVWDGKGVLVFGGLNASTGVARYLDDIVRFDPLSGTAAAMGATLPTGRDAAPAVWDGAVAYVFGGYNNRDWPARKDDIVRYDPTTDNATVLATKLPSRRLDMAAVWTGTHAFLLGGIGDNATHDGGLLDDIVRYTPDTAPPPPGCPVNHAPSSPVIAYVDGFHDGHHGWVGFNYTFAGDARGVTDPDGDPVRSFWTFGDGTTAPGSNASHAYAAGGAHRAGFVVQDDPSARNVAGCPPLQPRAGSASVVFTAVDAWAVQLTHPTESCVQDTDLPAVVKPVLALDCRAAGAVDTKQAPPEAVQRVEFRVDDAPFASDDAAPFQAAYHSLDFAPGFHDMSAGARASGDKYARVFASSPFAYLNV